MSGDRQLYLAALSRDGEVRGPVKIGFARDPFSRIAGFQTASPYRIVVHERWEIGASSSKYEKHLHEIFSDKRLNGEWFDLDPEDNQAGNRGNILFNVGRDGRARKV